MPRSGRTIARRSGIGVAGKLATLGLQTLHFALLARWLDASTFGTLMAALALLLILGGLAELGLTSGAVLALAEGREERTVVAATLRGSFALVGLALAVAAVATAVLLRGDARLAVVVLVPWFVLSNVDVAFLAVHQHHLRSGRIAAADLASRTVLLVAVLPLREVGDGSAARLLAWVGLGFLASELASLAIVVRGVPWRGGVARGEPWAMARRALPIGMTNASSMVHARSDQVILDAMGRRSGLAAYAVAARINEAVLSLANAAGAVSFPVIAQAAGADRDLAVRRFGRIACVVGALAAVGVFALAPQLLLLLGGPRFESSSDLARILTLALAVSVANLPFAQSVLARGRAARLLRLSITFAVANIVLTVALVVVLDESGAALATATTEVVGFLAVAWVAHALAPRSVPWAVVVATPVLTAGATWGALVLWRAGLEPVGVALAAAGTASLVALAAIDPGGHDRMHLRRTGRG